MAARTMAQASPPRTERMAFRLDRKTKHLVRIAADARGLTLTEFCLVTLETEARRTIERQRLLELGEADQQAFFKALRNPPEPNPRLRAAVRSYRARIRG